MKIGNCFCNACGSLMYSDHPEEKGKGCNPVCRKILRTTSQSRVKATQLRQQFMASESNHVATAPVALRMELQQWGNGKTRYTAMLDKYFRQV
jgi:hypothetical protein